ncbi:phospholipid-binding protein [uncultured Roseibium sp.]|uniref:phospholipid-binding protein n=1 Tax=uncultured Roseibium sp. TaxID=1936171 RepID=UPI0032173293
MFRGLVLGIALVAGTVGMSGSASAFDFSFQWGSIPKCTTGRPGRVPSPVFKLRNVPKGTATIRFDMKDLAVPTYAHGGGTVKYAGKKTIGAGAFKYNSPCPPGGSHPYQWTAVAKDKSGKKLATATAKRKYP